MSRASCNVLILVQGALALAFGAGAAEAGLFSHLHRGTPPPGRPRVIAHTHERAGNPLCISPHARPTDTPDYVGSYVGGGKKQGQGGEPRRVEEGTWGRDYVGSCLPRHVWLGWSHGRCAQGGTGAYETDGPFVPDVIGLTASKLRNH
jgi:hypothetical protein